MIGPIKVLVAKPELDSQDPHDRKTETAPICLALCCQRVVTSQNK